MKHFVFIFIFYCSCVFASAQSMKAYFTKSVDNSASLITDAQYSAHLEDTIVKFINEATISIDIAVWDNGSSEIVNALNDAYSRGVLVRYITSSNAFNFALSGLNTNISVLERNSTLTSNVMHNKFIVSDAEKLLTGSMNFGTGSMEDDFNNIVIIEDVPLATSYIIEFNEMWGGTAAQPNLANSKFGLDKSDNTPHNFTIGSSAVELYFSPTDNTTQKIVAAINSADFTLDVALFSFTNNDLGDAVIDAKNRGVDVRVIMENESYIGSEYNAILSAGIPIVSHEDVSYDFHHKYCIIDATHIASDPIVVTGSHNWTNSAEEEYDENTLIIHDAVMAGNYLEEFTQRWNENTTSVPYFYHSCIHRRHFNYSVMNDEIEFLSLPGLEKDYVWTIMDFSGKIIKQGVSKAGEKIYVNNYATGIYLFLVRAGEYLDRKDLIFVK